MIDAKAAFNSWHNYCPSCDLHFGRVPRSKLDGIPIAPIGSMLVGLFL